MLLHLFASGSIVILHDFSGSGGLLLVRLGLIHKLILGSRLVGLVCFDGELLLVFGFKLVGHLFLFK